MSSMNILVAEDEPTLRKTLVRILENSGHCLTAVENGKLALDLVQKNDYHLIILDLLMPTMDGFVFLEKFQVVKKKIPVLVLTNLDSDSDRQKAMKLGAIDVKIKSNIDLHEIVTYIETTISL